MFLKPLCTFGLLLTFQSFAQTPTIKSADTDNDKALQLRLDAAQFKGEGKYTKVEIYQSVRRDGLNYRKENHQYIASFRLETVMERADSSLQLGALQKQDTVADLAVVKRGQEFVYTVPFLTLPGEYRFTTTLIDENDQRQTHESTEMEVIHFSDGELALSDIQFATSIEKSSGPASMFDKNRLRVMPNPRALFGDGLVNLAFYTEVYSLKYSPEKAGNYQADYIIESEQGEQLYRLVGKPRAKNNQDAAIYASFDISSLTSGHYKLRVEVKDADSGLSQSVVKPFSVYRKADAVARFAEQERSVYDAMSNETLSSYFEQVKYIATDEDKKVFKELGVEAKREFMIHFWLNRDPTPGTPQNEFKEDYIQRLLKAKVHFSYPGTEGWKTDRGRILLTYGTPEFIDREPGSSDKHAYEIWNYERLQGRSTIFVFVDFAQNGQYRLIHSDYRNEVSDPNWEAALLK
jgi:GWxTD domain-containing protein